MEESKYAHGPLECILSFFLKKEKQMGIIRDMRVYKNKGT